jgi:uncharacterized membrane protein YfcA
MELDVLTVVLLTGAAFVAGFIDSIAGGGGLITIPALLFAGAGPLVAIATNKVQAIFGAGTAAVSYSRSGLVAPRSMVTGIAAAALASAVGALVATQLPAELLERAIPAALIGIALFFAFKPSIDDADRASRMTPVVFAATAIPAVGFYDGIFGPGTGSFFMVAFVGLAGYGVLRATAHTKVLNLASNLGAFGVFAVNGAIEWRIGLTMGLAQVAGAWFGSHVAIANGARLIKPVLVVTCIVISLRLLLS